MDFVSQNVAMPIQVQGTPLREAQRDIRQLHEEGQSQNGQPSQNEHTVTNGEGVQWEEDANLSTHHHKDDKVTKAQGSEPAGSLQEGEHPEDESKRISYRKQSECMQEDADLKWITSDVDDQKGKDMERTHIQRLVQLSDNYGKPKPGTQKADEDQSLVMTNRGRQHGVDQSASRRSSRSGSSCSPLGTELGVESIHHQQQQDSHKLKKVHGVWKPCETLQLWQADPCYDDSYRDFHTTNDLQLPLTESNFHNAYATGLVNTNNQREHIDISMEKLEIHRKGEVIATIQALTNGELLVTSTTGE